MWLTEINTQNITDNIIKNVLFSTIIFRGWLSYNIWMPFKTIIGRKVRVCN